MRAAINPDGFSEREIRDALETALHSPTFVRTTRLSRFLQFIVEGVLDGRDGELKEYVLALAVYDRPDSFDPKESSLIRVEATRLRSRLETYYEGPGRREQVVIELPKGGYTPRFRRRQKPVEVAAPSQPDETSLAVLPFVNLSAGVEDEYFADGLTEELIDALARTRDLKVLGRTSSFQFKHRNVDAREIGRQLTARWIVDGSVRRAGDRLRVTARLIDALSGRQMWSERFERRLADVFAVQDEITGAVVSSLTQRLATGGLTTAVKPRTEDLDAYELYLTGRYHWNKRTPADLRQCVIDFRDAIARDPHWPLPYCGLADAFGVQAMNGAMSPRDAARDGTAAAKKALALDPELPEAHTSLGFLRSVLEWDWEGGEAAFRLAVDGHPGAALGHYLYGMTNLGPQGRWDEAFREMRIALGLDPAAPAVRRDYGVLLFLSRDWNAALDQFRRVEELDPSFLGIGYWLGRVFEEQGHYEEALAAYERRLRAGEPNVRLQVSVAGVRALMGDRDVAGAQLKEFLAARPPTRPFDIAILQLRLGHRQKALACLEQAWHERCPDLYQIKVDPLYDALRTEPRFVAMVDQMGPATGS